MKRKTFLLPVTVFAALISLGLSACNNTDQPADKPAEESTQQPADSKQGAEEKITITAAGDKTKLMYGESVQLTASVSGVTWESSKPEVAAVDANGLVTSVSKGSASIKAKKDGYKDGSISISVDYPNITLTAADNKTSLLIGETVNLTASEQGVTWTSSNQEVATVNNGVVTAVGLGETTIKASKEHFNDGSLKITVTRPEASAIFDLTTDADHYSADGWWELPSAGGMMGFAMQTVNGWNPISQASSWGQQVENPETFIGGFGVGDKETIKFTAAQAGKAEIVLNIGNSDEVALGETMSAKLNGVAIDLSAVTLEAHAGDWGNSLAFDDLSLGELDLVAGENTLVFEFLADTNIFLNELGIYAGGAVTLVTPAVKEQLVITSTEVEVVEEASITLTADQTGVTWVSLDETIATVSDAGVVTGVKMGKTNIRIKKDGFYSAQVEITVNPKPVAGQIIIEAEDGEEVADSWGGTTYMRQADGGGFGGSSAVHSGGAYVTYFSMGGGDVDLTLTIKFQATEAKTMVLSIVGNAPASWQGEGSPYVFADSAEITVNETAMTFTDQQFQAASGMSPEMEEVVLGDVAVIAGENTLVFHTTGAAPSIDCFKLSVKA